MHELSIALSIVDMAVEELARREAGCIAAIHLKLGLLSGVVPDALRSSFELAREGTPLADTALVIAEIPVAAYCPQCAVERIITFPHLSCPVCDTPTPEIIRGRELEVVALEIESPCPEQRA
jgi:hydrogenase nickel incorporation protein HypA/HybF